MFHETRRAPDRTEFELSEESTRLPSTVDAQISAVPRQPLFCGSQQPFTGEISDEPGSSTDLLHISLGLDDSTPQRKQMARRSSGCGEKVHSSAVPRSQLWSADVRGVAATVIPLDAQYVPQEVAAILDGPHREGCGCSSGFVGCAVW
jgi:hypothetical protein